MRHTVCSRAVIEQSAFLRCFPDPRIIIAVSVEDNPLMILDRLLDHLMQRGFKILCLFKAVRINTQALCDCGIEHDVCAGNGVGGPKHAEFEFIAGKGKGRGPVAIRGVPVKLRQDIDAQLHLHPPGARIRRIRFNRFKDGIQFIPEEDGDHGRRCLVCTETMIVARCGNGNPQKILIIIHCLDDSAEEQQELGILMWRIARGKQVLSAIGGN